MSKLTAKYEYKKDGSKNIKGYNVSLSKVKSEESGFNKDSDVEIFYKKNKIEIIKK